METSKNNIYQAISQIMNEVGAIEKSQTNKIQGFKYRGIDDVMNALQPLLSKYKVFVVPEVLEQTREERQTVKGGNLIYSICKIKYTFYAEDGSNVSATVIGEGMDSGDKATNKAMAIAFKYAFFQVFCIPTEEMKDPDADTPEESKPKLSEKQLNRLYAIAAKSGTDKAEVDTRIKVRFNVAPADMTREQYNMAVAAYEAKSGVKS
jgi:hypothetical protein